jgi:hypothetical protein
VALAKPSQRCNCKTRSAGNCVVTRTVAMPAPASCHSASLSAVTRQVGALQAKPPIVFLTVPDHQLVSQRFSIKRGSTLVGEPGQARREQINLAPVMAVLCGQQCPVWIVTR